jgi:hypothetical protein
MTDIVIKAENLGKKYIIGHQAERGGYTALRDVLMQNVRVLRWRRLQSGSHARQGTPANAGHAGWQSYAFTFHSSRFTFHDFYLTIKS